MPLGILAALVLAGCAGGPPPAAPGTKGSAAAAGVGHPPAAPGLREGGRIIHRNDMIKITLRQPDHTLGSLETVQKNGDVATPDGSFVKAGGLSLSAFRTNLAAMYAEIPGYENVQIEAWILSCPYKIVKNNPHRLVTGTNSISKMTGPHLASGATATNMPPPTIFPRIFEKPLTIWGAIQAEGGVPPGVDPSKIKVLHQNLQRKTLDCSGRDGQPDGGTPVESGDYIFLVPEGTPISSLFE